MEYCCNEDCLINNVIAEAYIVRVQLSYLQASHWMTVRRKVLSSHSINFLRFWQATVASSQSRIIHDDDGD